MKESTTAVDYYRVLCPCCKGTKYQYNKLTGINIICPCCKGSGLDFEQNLEVEFGTSSAWNNDLKEIKE